jgi:TusA-related sulfurtransferase
MRGFQCPIPVVKTNQEIKTMDPGQVLKVLATDKGALADFPAWAEDTGNEIVSSGEEEGALVFLIRRGSEG